MKKLRRYQEVSLKKMISDAVKSNIISRDVRLDILTHDFVIISKCYGRKSRTEHFYYCDRCGEEFNIITTLHGTIYKCKILKKCDETTMDNAIS